MRLHGARCAVMACKWSVQLCFYVPAVLVWECWILTL
jgi:hypothetical protein